MGTGHSRRRPHEVVAGPEELRLHHEVSGFDAADRHDEYVDRRPATGLMRDASMSAAMTWARAGPRRRARRAGRVPGVYLTIADDGITLHQPERVNELYASYRQRLTPARLHEVLAEHGGGELLPDGNHVMVPVETLRRLAAGRVPEGWESDFAGMLSYAEGKGWTSEDGTAVRAHLEREM